MLAALLVLGSNRGFGAYEVTENLERIKEDVLKAQFFISCFFLF